MKVLTVANTKGGVGKSTIAVNLAACAAASGKRVIIIDADPQGSSLDWREIRAGHNGSLPEISAVAITRTSLREDIKNFDQSFDLAIIDVGGRDTGVLRAALLCCDHLLIPTMPSQFDIWATADTLSILEESRGFRDLPASLVLNCCKPRTKLTGEVREALSEIKAAELLPAALYHREDFKQAAGLGRGVIEHNPSSPAAREMVELWATIKELVYAN